jgi:hypothetical protein
MKLNLKASDPKRFRRLKRNELVSRGDFVADETRRFEPWDGLGGLPQHIQYDGRVYATIYGKSKGQASYRVAWRVAGTLKMAGFPSYSIARIHADALAMDLAKARA